MPHFRLANSKSITIAVAFVVKPPQSDITYHGWHQDIVDYGGTSRDGDGEYGGMSNFGNVLTITYLNHCSEDHGSTRIAPRFHRTADGAQPPTQLSPLPSA